MKSNILSAKKTAVIGMLTALIVVLGVSGLGIIHIPGLPFRITVLHIPVIIGAILEGPLVGALVGLLFGLWSIIDKVLRPTVTGFVFYNPLVSVSPRILIGIVAYYSYRLFKRYLPESAGICLSSILATATNTVGVLGMIYLLFAQQYMEALGKPKEMAFALLSGAAVSNGIPEAVTSAILVPIIIAGIKRLRKNT